METNPRKLKVSRRTIVGLAFIYLAGVGWLAEFFIPFINIDHKAPIFIGVLAVAEVSFLVGVAILGKPVYESLKAKLVERLKNRKPQP